MEQVIYYGYESEEEKTYESILFQKKRKEAFVARDAMKGSLGYLLTALVVILRTGAWEFRYSTFDNGKFWLSGRGKSGTDTNFLEIASKIISYGDLALMCPAFLLQLLSMSGKAVEFNEFWWKVAVSNGTLLVHTIAFFLQFLGLDRDWSDSLSTSTLQSQIVGNVASFALM